MLENILKFTAKVDDEVSYWYLANGTKIEVAEKMCLQFLQMIGNIKAQQEAQKMEESLNQVKDSQTSVDDYSTGQEPTPAE